MKKVNQSILDLVDDYLIPFQRKPFQSKIPFQFVTSREQQKLMDKEVKECWRMRQWKNQYSRGRVFKQFGPCKKEGWSTKACNKSETSKYIYTIQSHLNERIAGSEVFITRGRLPVQGQFKGCILLWSFTEKLEEVHSVPLVRKLTWISLPMFYLGSCLTNFHKDIENPNCNFVSHKYKNGYLLGQNASNESLLRRDEHVSWQGTLLVRTPGFCNHLEKICLTPVQEIKFWGLKINSVNLETSHRREKYRQ